ncbi:RadC family protein [Paenibacillus ihuae]|uniref:RadC family protein n=1 Tax=Paenibacillus ihuae TaxID=1232431 RepID=UPI0006D54167|nr:DNA repair protein RadC [Paenibacillus ihuae]
MLTQRNIELKSLLTDSLREKQGSYLIEELMNRFPSVTDLIEVTEQELISISGIGPHKARQIVAILKLARTLIVPDIDFPAIRKPEDAYHLLEPEHRYNTKEHFICLYLNTKNRVIHKETISIGSLNASIVHPREVFKVGIKRSCASIICSHSHPSGDPTPSNEDLIITHRLIEAGEIIGIDVLDHLIIAGQRYVSLKEQGLMARA